MIELSKKEYDWLNEKTGYISASKLNDLTTSGRGGRWWGDTAIAYLYKLQRERKRGIPSPILSAKPLSFGNENEPYAIEWLKENYDREIRDCSRDFATKIFRKREDVMFGASPDAILGTPDNVSHIFEIKCVYGEKETNWMFSDTVPYEEKKAAVLKEHRSQLGGLLLAFEECENISLLKYDAQRDDNPFDCIDPMDKSRGVLFEFTRADFGDYLEDVWPRILMADSFLKNGFNPDNINSYYFKITQAEEESGEARFTKIEIIKNE
jgi:hypothetical protein